MVIEVVEKWLTLNREHEEFRDNSFVLVAHLLLFLGFLFFFINNLQMNAPLFLLVLGGASMGVNAIGMWLLRDQQRSTISKWLAVMVVVISSLLYISDRNGHNNDILAVAFTLVVPVFSIFVLGYRVGSIVTVLNFVLIFYICSINSAGWKLGSAETYSLMHLTAIYFLLSAISFFYDSSRRRMMKLLMLSNVKFQQLSITDKLTQLPNRLYIEDLLVSSKQVYWIVILDVDDFKKINDNYGHDVGDRVLQIIANKIQKNVSGSGVACRWGGEEFLIAFYLRDIEMVKETIVRLQQDVVSFDFGLNQSITFSCGGAPHQPRHYRNAFCQADEALYRAKKAGKNSFFYDLVAKDS